MAPDVHGAEGAHVSDDGIGGPGWGEVEPEVVHKLQRMFNRECTGLTAHWCPNHGTCVCTRLNENGAREWDSLDHQDCPLHGAGSDHPRKRRVRVFTRRPSKP